MLCNILLRQNSLLIILIFLNPFCHPQVYYKRNHQTTNLRRYSITQHQQVFQHSSHNSINKDQCSHQFLKNTINQQYNVQVSGTRRVVPFNQTLQHEKTQKQISGASALFQPIRIFVDYSLIDQEKFGNYITELKEKYMKAALAYLHDAINVYPLSQPLRLNDYANISYCGYDYLKFPEEHLRDGIPDSDLVIYIIGNDSDFGYLAYSQVCDQGNVNTDTGRQTVGYMKINFAALQQDIEQGLSNRWITTLIHEIIHILAFNPQLYSSFITSDGYPLYYDDVISVKDNRTFLIVQPLLDYAREHFGCPFAEGVPLEDNGEWSAYCHFERTALGNEAMTASRLGDQVFSNFTLKLLESTGWYLPNYQMAQPFSWGKEEGCVFLNGSCPQYAYEFCVYARKDYVSCSIDYSALSDCWEKDTFAIDCPYWKNIYNAQCKVTEIYDYKRLTERYEGSIGLFSACLQTNFLNNHNQKFEGYAIAANCFTTFCSIADEQLTLFILLSQSQLLLNCSFSYQEIVTERGSIYCPDIKQFCNYPSACPNSCSLRGQCRDGACICYTGFKGIDCSEEEK